MGPMPDRTDRTSRDASGPSYRLVPSSRTIEPPELDDQQRAVVEHAGGPLLVLAGPGTGKTTTLVEAIARRIEQGAHPDSILALTFSRKAAEQLEADPTRRAEVLARLEAEYRQLPTGE